MSALGFLPAVGKVDLLLHRLLLFRLGFVAFRIILLYQLLAVVLLLVLCADGVVGLQVVGEAVGCRLGLRFLLFRSRPLCLLLRTVLRLGPTVAGTLLIFVVLCWRIASVPASTGHSDEVHVQDFNSLRNFSKEIYLPKKSAPTNMENKNIRST